jgi:hypothetical protein
VQADDLPLALGVYRHGDYRGDRDDAAALALLEVGGVEPEIRPLASERAIEEGTDTIIDVLAQLAHRALADPRQPHRLHQVVDTPGRDPADPGFLDHGHQRLLRGLPGLEERREVAALPQLGDPELQGPQARVQAPIPISIPIRGPVAGSLVTSGTDQPVHVGLHQQLHHGLGHAAQEVAISGFRQQLGQR